MADYYATDEIRRTIAVSVHNDLPPGKWISASAENVLGFGAATYFFARSIYNEYKVPIGIINSSVGGTPIEAWISEEGLEEFPLYVRYAWADNPEGANLYNIEGLPASPFEAAVSK